MNIILRQENGVLKFIDPGIHETEIYSIDINALNETRKSGEAKISEWISQLNEKSWASPNLLYRVAKVIKDHFPSNAIDWKTTFFQVEKNDYLEKYSDLQNALDDSSGSSSKDDFMKRIEIGRQENVSQVNDAIFEIVLANLKENGIVE